MHKSLVTLAVFGALVSPATAQTAPQPPAPVATGAPVPAVAPKMIKKTVCQRVVIEETTGSRLGSAPKRCRTIEVPAPTGKDARNGERASSERGE